jgi:hypothetical protein
MNKMKQWQCGNGHGLGVICWNGNDVPQLMLYRHAIDYTAEKPAAVDLMIGPLIGNMPVQCDICNDVKLWDISVDALAELIVSLQDDKIAQLQARIVKMQQHSRMKVAFE